MKYCHCLWLGHKITECAICLVCSYGHFRPLRSPHGLFTDCLRSLNPYRARKLIIHALKLYWSRTGRKKPYGGTPVPYDFVPKTVEQPGWCPGYDLTVALMVRKRNA